MNIPKPIIAVVDSARRLVRVRADLRVAIDSGEINAAGIEKRRKALQAAIKTLVRDVTTLERELEALRKRGKSSAVPWASIFNAVGEFTHLVAKVKSGGNVTRDAVKWASKHGPKSTDDIIDAEIVE